ncbi:MAG TPA: hypothetical protein VKS82_17900 [Streptosporangiaceae bacterium]|jgi:hypothetical protein|nr:hypothetical protein [Streptosporangiaceae bacterium]
MSTGDLRPQDGREPRLTQRGMATHGGRVMQAGRNQYIVNLGNAAWVTVPVVLAVAVVLVLYLTIGHPARASGSPSPGTATSRTGQPPLTIALAYDQHDVDNGMGSCMNWLFDRPLHAIPVPDSPPDETWARRYGGVDVGVTNFKLDVQGVTTTAVQLLDFRVVDVERGSVPAGTDVISSDGCGPAPEAGFEIFLGRNPPLITPVAGLDNGAAKKIPFPFRVSSTDIQQFQVQALDTLQGPNPCGCDIKWRLALDWSYEGKTGTTVIDDHGKPFQTVFPALNSGGNSWFPSSGGWRRFG